MYMYSLPSGNCRHVETFHWSKVAWGTFITGKYPPEASFFGGRLMPQYVFHPRIFHPFVFDCVAYLPFPLLCLQTLRYTKPCEMLMSAID